MNRKLKDYIQNKKSLIHVRNASNKTSVRVYIYIFLFLHLVYFQSYRFYNIFQYERKRAKHEWVPSKILLNAGKVHFSLLF